MRTQQVFSSLHETVHCHKMKLPTARRRKEAETNKKKYTCLKSDLYTVFLPRFEHGKK
jgi:hypothetical protein